MVSGRGEEVQGCWNVTTRGKDGVMKERGCSCPGSAMVDRREQVQNDQETVGKVSSQLRQWPIQMHLIQPTAPYYKGADVLLVADCVAFALGGFHPDYLKGKAIAIACPKLDEGQEVYEEKIKAWLEDAKINTLTVMIMEVPCCMGLFALAESALAASKRKVPLKRIIVGLDGEIRHEDWVTA